MAERIDSEGQHFGANGISRGAHSGVRAGMTSMVSSGSSLFGLVQSGATGVNSGGLVEQIAETLFPPLECLFSPHDLAMPANGVVLLEYCSPSIMSQLLFETPSCQTATA